MTSSRLDIVGGLYGEECAYPRRQMFRGSGGRAAAFMSTIIESVRLHSSAGKELTPIFEELAYKFGFELSNEPKDSDAWFRYRHPLARPDIHFDMNQSYSIKTTEVHADKLLVYGMLEGRPKTTSEWAVYDPQDGSKSQPFEFNGSSAKHLALIVSYSEGKALTGESKVLDIASKLIAGNGVEVVIVKCGPKGAFVSIGQQAKWVKPIPSKKVYKIGSGDIFSAAFAYSWMLKNNDPFYAACFASYMTSQYVETGQDRINATQISFIETELSNGLGKFISDIEIDIPKSHVYLAGPFFNTAQQWLIDEVREALLDMGFNVFSPIHDVGIGSPFEVAPKDLFSLEEAGVVLAVVDGLDSGTLFEIGYARGIQIPVVVIAESVQEKDLCMIIGSGCEVSNDLTTGVYAACWQLMGYV